MISIGVYMYVGYIFLFYYFVIFKKIIMDIKLLFFFIFVDCVVLGVCIYVLKYFLCVWLCYCKEYLWEGMLCVEIGFIFWMYFYKLLF